jgi:hypothetical protein
VVLAEHLAKELTLATGLSISVAHRDLGRLPERFPEGP